MGIYYTTGSTGEWIQHVILEGAAYRESLLGAYVLPPLTDIQVRIANVSNNSTIVMAGYNILVVQNV